MNTQEYFEYVKKVKEFFEYEGINCLTVDEDCEEPSFRSSYCDVCSGLAGDKYDCSGYHPETKEVLTGYEVCPDCMYYINHGQLDDMTMMDVDLEELAKLREEER